jgi:hypothetical protein
METMHPAGRRTLPPVPRTSSGPTTQGPATQAPVTPAPAARVPAEQPPAPTTAVAESDALTERFLVDLSTGEQRALDPADVADTGSADETASSIPVPPARTPRLPAADAERELDLAQQLVARLRAAATDFAAAAGAESAVVREAVPPARHRRARCRMVFRYTDEREVDVTFLGPAGLPDEPSRHGFDRQIRRWLTAGQRRDDAWLVSDPEASDGIAIDLTAWVRAA